jgi:hypothetical protein
VSFPLRIGDHRFATPPSLAQAVREDAAAGGGRVVPGQKPRDWVLGLVTAKLLPKELAVALVAALLQDPTASTLTECCHLARALSSVELGAVLMSAAESHDVGVLLVAAPGEQDRSVEDVLLLAAADLIDAADASLRVPLLEQLRYAGLSQAELKVLARGATDEEVRIWLPSVLLEDPVDGVHLAELLVRPATRKATIDALNALDEPRRRTLWSAARDADRRIAIDSRLRTALFAKVGLHAGAR